MKKIFLLIIFLSASFAFAKQTEFVRLQGNLDANDYVGEETLCQTKIFDAAGEEYFLSFRFSRRSDIGYNVEIDAERQINAGQKRGTYRIAIDQKIILAFNSDGTVLTPLFITLPAKELREKFSHFSVNIVFNADLKVIFGEIGRLTEGVTNYSGLHTMFEISQDGYPEVSAVEENFSPEIFLSPNISSIGEAIKISSQFEGKTKIFDALGNTIDEFFLPRENFFYTIQKEKFSSGMYFILVEGEKKNFLQKIIIQ